MEPNKVIYWNLNIYEFAPKVLGPIWHADNLYGMYVSLKLSSIALK